MIQDYPFFIIFRISLSSKAGSVWIVPYPFFAYHIVNPSTDDGPGASIVSTKSNEKLKQLGIKQLSVLYTQGQYDFVETIDAPGPASVLGFTIWYSEKGFGTIQTLPAFGDQEIRNIIKKG